MVAAVVVRSSVSPFWATMAIAIVSIEVDVRGASLAGTSPECILGPGVGTRTTGGRGCKDRKHLQQDRRESGKIGVRRHGRIRNYSIRSIIIRSTKSMKNRMGLRRVPITIRQKSVRDVRDFDSRRMNLYIQTHRYGIGKYTLLGKNETRVEFIGQFVSQQRYSGKCSKCWAVSKISGMINWIGLVDICGRSLLYIEYPKHGL